MSPLQHLKHRFGAPQLVPTSTIPKSESSAAGELSRPGSTPDIHDGTFRGLVERAAHGIAVVSVAGKPMYGNFAFANLMGLHTTDELLRLDRIHSQIARGDKVRFGEVLMDCLGGRNATSVTHVRTVRSNGEPARVQITAQPTVWPEGDAVMLNAVEIRDECHGLPDSAEARPGEFDLVEPAKRAKSQFLTNVSHELRTPLNSIIGFADILEAEMLGPHTAPQYREYAADIQASGRQLLDLINDILDVSKIEAGALDLFEESIDVHEVLGSCESMVKAQALRQGVTICCHAADDLPALQADSMRVTQILVGILTNAVKSASMTGSITMNAALNDDNGLVFAVAHSGDSGGDDVSTGMAEPFSQFRTASHDAVNGSGLGATLVKALVELHGGRLEVDCAPNGDTEVRVVFTPERTLFPA